MHIVNHWSYNEPICRLLVIIVSLSISSSPQTGVPNRIRTIFELHRSGLLQHKTSIEQARQSWSADNAITGDY